MLMKMNDFISLTEFAFVLWIVYEMVSIKFSVKTLKNHICEIYDHLGLNKKKGGEDHGKNEV